MGGLHSHEKHHRGVRGLIEYLHETTIGDYVDGYQPELIMAKTDHTIAETLDILLRAGVHSVPIWFEEQATDMGLVDSFDMVSSLSAANAINTQKGIPAEVWLVEWLRSPVLELADLSGQNPCVVVEHRDSLLSVLHRMTGSHLQRCVLLDAHNAVHSVVTKSLLLRFLSHHIEIMTPSECSCDLALRTECTSCKAFSLDLLEKKQMQKQSLPGSQDQQQQDEEERSHQDTNSSTSSSSCSSVSSVAAFASAGPSSSGATDPRKETKQEKDIDSKKDTTKMKEKQEKEKQEKEKEKDPQLKKEKGKDPRVQKQADKKQKKAETAEEEAAQRKVDPNDPGVMAVLRLREEGLSLDPLKHHHHHSVDPHSHQHPHHHRVHLHRAEHHEDAHRHCKYAHDCRFGPYAKDLMGVTASRTIEFVRDVWSAIEAFDYMLKKRRSSMPIVGEKHLVVGNLSISDIRVVNQDNATLLEGNVVDFLKKTDRFQPPIVLDPFTPFHECVNIMYVNRVHHVYVADAEVTRHRFPDIGVIALTDLLEWIAQEARHHQTAAEDSRSSSVKKI